MKEFLKFLKIIKTKLKKNSITELLKHTIYVYIHCTLPIYKCRLGYISTTYSVLFSHVPNH